MSIEEKIKENVPLAPFSTFQVGGPAKYFLEIKTKEELKEAIEWAEKKQIRIFILGGGSNLVINDLGVDGLVIKLINDEISIRGDRLDCGAGASLARVVRISVSQGLSGVEWAGGIPGATIGGTVLGNGGAYGNSISEVIETVEVYNRKKKTFEIFSKNFCNFDYKNSLFKEVRDYIIFQAVLKLVKLDSAVVNSKVEELLKMRVKHQPKLPNAGCVFKNFLFEEIENSNAWLAEKAIKDKMVKGGKVGAGWLVDLLELKGKTIGGAKVSLEHANFIVNTGKATSEDIIMLISYIKQQVRDRYQIQMYEELQYFGY